MKFTRAEIEGVKRHPVIVEFFRQLNAEAGKKLTEATNQIKQGNVAAANYYLGLSDQIQRTFELLDSLGPDAQNAETTPGH